MNMTESEYKNALRAGRGGAYVLCGEESYLIRHYRDRTREPYSSPEAEYDRAVVGYETKADADAIVDAAATPVMSMMSMLLTEPDAVSRKRLVEVSVEAADGLKDSDFDALIGAMSASSEYADDAIVLLCLMPGTFDCGEPPKRPSAAYKKLCATDGVNVVYFPATTPAQLRRWVERHFTHEGITPEWDAADAMVSLVGEDMTSLSGEIDKLTSYVRAHGRDHVTKDDVAAVCCRGDRYDAFALSNAILDKRRDAALSALYDEMRRKTEPVIVSAGIARVLSDIMAVKALLSTGASAPAISQTLGMHEYKVKLYMKSASARTEDEIERAVLACADADRRIKSTGGGYEALERLVCEVGA